MKDVIIAGDFINKKDFLNFLDKFGDIKPFVKIGMMLYFANGPDIVKEIKARGHKIFLDLKLHDIPNTIEGAMRVLSSLDADICNLHALGGTNMMKAAVRAFENVETILLAVTQLTSTSQEILESELLIKKPMSDAVIHLAKLAKESGLNGVVCSPHEVQAVKKACGEDFIALTPGIRFDDNTKGDQVRITTPKQAKELGSDFIVVGRPITEAADPVEVYKRCVNEFL